MTQDMHPTVRPEPSCGLNRGHHRSKGISGKLVAAFIDHDDAVALVLGKVPRQRAMKPLRHVDGPDVSPFGRAQMTLLADERFSGLDYQHALVHPAMLRPERQYLATSQAGISTQQTDQLINDAQLLSGNEQRGVLAELVERLGRTVDPKRFEPERLSGALTPQVKEFDDSVHRRHGVVVSRMGLVLSELRQKRLLVFAAKAIDLPLPEERAQMLVEQRHMVSDAGGLALFTTTQRQEDLAERGKRQGVGCLRGELAVGAGSKRRPNTHLLLLGIPLPLYRSRLPNAWFLSPIAMKEVVDVDYPLAPVVLVDAHLPCLRFNGMSPPSNEASSVGL